MIGDKGPHILNRSQSTKKKHRRRKGTKIEKRSVSSDDVLSAVNIAIVMILSVAVVYTFLSQFHGIVITRHKDTPPANIKESYFALNEKWTPQNTDINSVLSKGEWMEFFFTLLRFSIRYVLSVSFDCTKLPQPLSGVVVERSALAMAGMDTIIL